MAEVGIRDGVQVNAINPGYIRTDRLRKRLAGFASERDFVAQEKITRIGEPEDIAGLAAFVVGPAGRYSLVALRLSFGIAFGIGVRGIICSRVAVL